MVLTELCNWTQSEATNSLHPYISNFSNVYINPLNTKLNPICHFLALLGVHPKFHVRRIRVKNQPPNHGLANSIKVF